MTLADKVEVQRILVLLASMGKLHVTVAQGYALQQVNSALCNLARGKTCKQ